jgi:chromosome segregation ATPase
VAAASLDDKARLHALASDAVRERDELARMLDQQKAAAAETAAELARAEQLNAALRSEITTAADTSAAERRELERETARWRDESQSAAQAAAARISVERGELERLAASWRDKAGELEVRLAEKAKAFELLSVKAESNAKQLELFYTTLNTASSDVAALQQTVAELKSKATHAEHVKGMLTAIREEINAGRAVANLKLLLKSADATDAATHVEFERLKEKSLEQQLQVLVYNITACEAHMQQCDPEGTRKQQGTRAQRIDKLVDKLREAEARRDDYLESSRTNRARLDQLLRDAEAKLDAAKSNTQHILKRQLPDLIWSS